MIARIVTTLTVTVAMVAQNRDAAMTPTTAVAAVAIPGTQTAGIVGMPLLFEQLPRFPFPPCLFGAPNLPIREDYARFL